MRYLLLALSLFIFNNVSAQDFWKKASNGSFRVLNGEEPLVKADISLNMILDYQALKEYLDVAQNKEEQQTISLPLPDGNSERFIIERTVVMESEIAKKYSHVLTFKGRSIDNPSIITRFDISDYGFNASITTPDAKYFISPYTQNNLRDYVTYDVSSMDNDDLLGVPTCGVTGEEVIRKGHNHTSGLRTENNPLRRYRIAISSTGEWGSRLETVDAAMTYIISSVNLMNEIFENELSINYIIVDRNDELLHFDKDNDPYINTASGSSMLSINTAVINSIIGPDSYDLGHVYNTSCDVGGVARLGSLCSTFKGGAVTCLAGTNMAYYVNVTAHEIGHQMSAQHTFNNCNGNESLGNGFEPGSGTTIMSYSGLCGNQNIENNIGDNYYHSASLYQIYDHTRVGLAEACAEKIEIENNVPSARPSSVFVENLAIPTFTPFVLEGSGSDENEGNEVSYTWEQMNSGPQSSLGNPLGSAPRFRVFPPDDKDFRILPRAINILNGISTVDEVLPETDLDLAFNFVVRDNNAGGGTAVWERVEFESVHYTEEEGRFKINSFNNPTTMEPGRKIVLTWNVSNTAGSAINSQLMDLYYSTLSGSSFDFNQMTTIAERIPNTGSFEMYIPSQITSVGRFFLRGHDNIYFDVTNSNLTVKEPTTPTLVVEAFPFIQQVCSPSTPEVMLETVGFTGIEGNVVMDITAGLPEGVQYSFSNEDLQVGESTNLSFDLSGFDRTEVLELEITSIVADVDTFVRHIILDVVNNDHSSIIAVTPEDNRESAPTNLSFAWTISENADTYDFELATSPAFGDHVIYSLYGTTATHFTPADLLDVNTVYYWRVRGNNECSTGYYQDIHVFSTEVVSCTSYTTAEDVLPKFISASGSPEIEVLINIPDAGNIADVNISSLDIDHSLNKDLKVTLTSPSGTQITLFENICNQSDVRCGFDDQSNRLVQCPLNNSIRYRPQQPLEAFMNENQQGDWVLIVDDQQPGNGGELNNIVIEICGSKSFQAPYLVVNELMKIPPGASQGLRSSLLTVADDNNTAEELTYTLISVPTLGSLSLHGETLIIGDQFTQDDVDNIRIFYKSPDTDEGNDSFNFIVQDVEGGFLGITRYDIDINEEHPNSTNEIPSGDLSMYPVPARDFINLEISSTHKVSHYKMFDINGRLVQSDALDNISRINTSSLPSGMYLINIIGENTSTTRKVSIIK